MRSFSSPAELAETIGGELGAGEWLAVQQPRVDLFAEATGDRQWIHVDPARAEHGPFGGTIAHGYLTLSLLPYLVKDIYRLDGVTMAVNYGLDKVRFISPVRVGSSVRAVMSITSVGQVPGGVQVAADVRIEIRGEPKPAAAVETLTRLYL